jgi:hypothetical protein
MGSLGVALTKWVLAAEGAVVSWLAADYQRRRMRSAVMRAYQRFAAEHPEWAESLFDAWFIERHVLPLLCDGEASSRRFIERWEDEIATMWAEQLPGSEPFKRARRAAVRAVAARFLALVTCELDRPSVASEQVDAAACL